MTASRSGQGSVRHSGMGRLWAPPSTVMITVIEPPAAAKRMRSASVILPSAGSWAVGQVGEASGDALASGETLPVRFDEHAASAPITRQTPIWLVLRPIVPNLECLLGR